MDTFGFFFFCFFNSSLIDRFSLIETKKNTQTKTLRQIGRHVFQVKAPFQITLSKAQPHVRYIIHVLTKASSGRCFLSKQVSELYEMLKHQRNAQYTNSTPITSNCSQRLCQESK